MDGSYPPQKHLVGKEVRFNVSFVPRKQLNEGEEEVEFVDRKKLPESDSAKGANEKQE